MKLLIPEPIDTLLYTNIPVDDGTLYDPKLSRQHSKKSYSL